MASRAATYAQCWALACLLCTVSVPAHAFDRVPSPAQTAAAAPSLRLEPADPRTTSRGSDDASLFESPWFWAGVAGVVAAGIVIGLVVANSKDEPAVPQGTLKLSVSVLTKAPCGNASTQR